MKIYQISDTRRNMSIFGFLSVGLQHRCMDFSVLAWILTVTQEDDISPTEIVSQDSIQT